MRNLTRFTTAMAILALLSGCASTHRTTSTFDGPKYSGPGYTNILIIGVADSYNNRTTYERLLAQDLSAGNASATAYYTLADKDAPIDRAAVEKAVKEGGFDAVLISRVLNRGVTSKTREGSAMTKVTRKEGKAVDLFRYDYEELNEPSTINMEVTIVMSSELYDAASSNRAWAIETEFAREASVGVIIVDAVSIVADRVRRDGLIAR